MNGQEIRSRRLALNLTQEELAAHFGTTKNTIARWEREERKPDMPLVLLMAFNWLEQELPDDKRHQKILADLKMGMLRSREKLEVTRQRVRKT